jgi:hypothetical protein
MRPRLYESSLAGFIPRSASLIARLFLFLAVSAAQTASAQGTTNPKFAKWLKPMDWKRDSDQPVFTIGEG